MDDFPVRLGTAIGHIEALLDVIDEPAQPREKSLRALHEKWIARARAFVAEQRARFVGADHGLSGEAPHA